jgi:hypothetical protein
MAVLEQKVDNLGSILGAVEEFSRTWDPDPFGKEELWFRGVSKREYKLLPAIYRIPRANAAPFDEVNLFERFKALAVAFSPNNVESDWDWYFLAQHHRLPTRLLDWTEGLLTAVYFAIWEDIEPNGPIAVTEKASLPSISPDFSDQSPVVWVLDAGSLNRLTIGPDDDAIICPRGPFGDDYLPDNISTDTEENRLPFALLATRTNARIVAQQGMFTIHGRDRSAIEDLVNLPGGQELRIGRIIIDRNSIAKVWLQLERTGFHRLSLFPELDSVSFNVKWGAENHI